MSAPKKFVICTDGTWNTPKQTDRGKKSPTNVAKFYQAVSEHDNDGVRQLRYYDSGVGTSGFIDRIFGGAFGIGLSRNIKDAYIYLAKHYNDGDEIYLTGFSRGAYTARSLGGIIGRCGIPREATKSAIEAAYKLYRSKSPTQKQLDSVRRKAHYPASIHFIGVWDTVGALGIPGRFKPLKSYYNFHNTDIGTGVRHAYHALAIDERRSPYKPTLWHKPASANHVQMEQRWFVGAHSNVGGGYADCGLSDLALKWMIERAAGAGLAFDDVQLENLISPNFQGELRDECGWFYSAFFRPGWRKIRAGDARRVESIDASAIDRRAVSDLGYNPPNLEAAIRDLKKFASNANDVDSVA